MSKEDGINALRDIGKTLSEGVSKNPLAASIPLVLVIVGIVVIVFCIKEQHSFYALKGFFILAMLAIFMLSIAMIFNIGLVSQKDKIKRVSPTSSEEGEQGLNLFDNLNINTRQNLKAILQNAVSDVSSKLEISSLLVRSNIFILGGDNILRIAEDLYYNMLKQDELTISMPPGYGSTGRCFSTSRPNIAILSEDWGGNIIEDNELRKAHPDLRWIFSIPIIIGQGLNPIGILNVDGLEESRSEDEIKETLSDLLRWSGLIATTLLYKESQ